MGQFVAICGSLGEGMTVFGPYINKLSAELDTEERVRGGWCDASIIDFLPLTLDNTLSTGGWVLVLGNFKEGFAVYGTYARAEGASNANSPFRRDPLNPHTSDGLRQAVVLPMLPPLT
jgi:hypothetical protein